MAARDVEIYTTAFCPYCARAKGFFEENGIPFKEIPVDGDAAQRSAMVERSGGRRTVPQIFVGDRHIGGCDDLLKLVKAGDLDSVLRETTG